MAIINFFIALIITGELPNIRILEMPLGTYNVEYYCKKPYPKCEKRKVTTYLESYHKEEIEYYSSFNNVSTFEAFVFYFILKIRDNQMRQNRAEEEMKKMEVLI